MSIDPIQANQANTEMARRLASKQTELTETESALKVQQQKTASLGRQKVQQTIDDNEKNLVNISKEGEQAAERIKTQQHLQVQSFNQNSQEHFTKVTQEAAERMKALDAETASQLSNHQRANLERLAFVESRSEDPFYRLKSFDAHVTEAENEFKLVVKLPPHEAQNLFITANDRDLKLSLARSYEANEKTEEGRQNRTYSYQTILEHIDLPAKVNQKGITREYADGALTVKLPKNI